MVFTPPSWSPACPDVPDSITIAEFLANEKYGRYPLAKSRNPFTCGVTGKTYSAVEVVQRTDYLSRAVGKRLGFNAAEGTEWDRVVGFYAVNTIDFTTTAHSILRLSGIVTPANAAYNDQELEHQLRTSGAKALITCVPLLENALKAAKAVGIPHDRIFLLPVPGTENETQFKTIDDLIEEGKHLSPLPPLNWIAGQGKRQTAFLCFSSGTSGLPKAVMISHYNVIANILQFTTQESVSRKKFGIETQVCLGVLPFSHIYGLTVVAHSGFYCGDQVAVLPKFELELFLSAVQRFKIQRLFVVPPMLINMIANRERCDKFDLSSVRSIFSGAAPLGTEVIESVLKVYPEWHIGQGYGMTECSPVATNTSETDILFGSSGSLVPGSRAKLVDMEGKEVTEYDKPGELLHQSPAVVLGYLHNEKANAETFVWDKDGRWLKTGDEVVVRKSAQGFEHFVVVDRIKELIKVKGFQVAPAELEAHILAHRFVSDCAVIPVPDDFAGEVPKAYVVKSKDASGKSDEEIANAVRKHVEEHKVKYKWLQGGVEFIDVIPKSPSGKILRRLLRDKERQARQKNGPKL